MYVRVCLPVLCVYACFFFYSTYMLNKDEYRNVSRIKQLRIKPIDFKFSAAEVLVTRRRSHYIFEETGSAIKVGENNEKFELMHATRLLV